MYSAAKYTQELWQTIKIIQNPNKIPQNILLKLPPIADERTPHNSTKTINF